MQLQEVKGSRSATAGHNTEHTNINYKRVNEKLEEREHTERINSRVQEKIRSREKSYE